MTEQRVSVEKVHSIEPEIYSAPYAHLNVKYLDADSIRPLIRTRMPQAHKGDFGHCLILAASTGKTGAAALCANSAVRTGSGLVTAAVPSSLNSIIEIKTTEAMSLPLDDAGLGHITVAACKQIENAIHNKDCLAIGPGIGRHPETTSVVRRLVETADIPMVIDADGLNAVAVDTSILLRKQSATVILTPHPGEMERLTGSAVPVDDCGRITIAKDFSQKYGIYLVLKGAHTVVATPDGTSCINTSGNPGMASGGMGDVLTGIITSLLGQGYSAYDACRIGVFIHGFAADLVVEDKGVIGINATDVIEKLPYAFKKLGEAGMKR
jgi:ADP-dependent NAD(P)H-hydrate dehydratase / NAD(P)H-hydrate epimerase